MKTVAINDKDVRQLLAPMPAPPAAAHADDAPENMQLLVYGVGASANTGKASATFDFTLRGERGDNRLLSGADFVPMALPHLGEYRITHVACGLAHVMLLSSTGQLFALGDNSNGALGVPGAGDKSLAAAAVVELPSACVSISCGPLCSGAVVTDGRFLLWGKMGGSKGGEPLVNSSVPVAQPMPEPFATLCIGHLVVVLVARTGGRCFAWGSNAEFGLPLAAEKASFVQRTPEPVTLAGGQHNGAVVQVHCHGSVSTALTDKGDLFVWGGKKGAGLPTLVSTDGLPSTDALRGAALSHNGDTVWAVLESGDGAVYSKPRMRKATERWRRAEGLDQPYESVVVGDEQVFLRQRSTGKVVRHALKTGDSVPINSIRVAHMAHSPCITVLVLAVHNTRGRIFGALHPEPLLKLATARGMIEWLVKTGCRYPSDLVAFTFAFPVLLKLLLKEKSKDGSVRKARAEMAPAGGTNPALSQFVRLLKKTYQLSDGHREATEVVRSGVNQLLNAWIESRPPAHDVRAVLGLTQSFLGEGDQASLWKRENLRAVAPSSHRGGAAGTEGRAGGTGGSGLELEDISAVPPRNAALVLTALRHAQFQQLSSNDVVNFCMVAPDPAAFEMYPLVAEFVDVGNTMNRWGKMFVLRGGSKSARGDRLKWLYALIQELEALRNFDLAFHFSGALLWELMPDIAKQAKVDLDSMFAVVKRFGDKKFWNGPYQKALSEQQSMIPLLVYHSNSISGGFGGSDSLVDKRWEGEMVTYLNVAKFRSIGDQKRSLQQIASWDQQYAQMLKGVARESELYVYFQHLTAPTDAALTVMRSEIIKVSKHRESGKVTSIDAFAGDVVAAVAARERRVVKWSALVTLLESDEETVRLREAPFLVCPRDAVLDGALLPGVVKSLLQTAGNIEWASHEYWLLRRLLLALVPKQSLEDILMSAATLYERSVDVMPQACEALCTVFVDFVARGAGTSPVIKAAQVVEATAFKLGPELDQRVLEFESKMTQLKEKGGALSRAQKLMTIGSTTGWEEGNETLRAVKQKASDTDESVKLTKAQLEHFGAQRSLVRSTQGAARDFGVLLDLWRAQQARAALKLKPAVYFRVTHLGNRWGDGENLTFIHQEAPGTRMSDFQEKLVSMYETVFGADGVQFLDVQKDTKSATFKAGVAYLQVAAVRLDETREAGEEIYDGLVFVLEVPFVREGSSDPWKKRIRYFTENAFTKKRLRVAEAKTSLLSPIESSVIDITARAEVIRRETLKASPDSSTAYILQQAMAPQTNTGLLKACAHLVDPTRRQQDREVLALSLAMWDFLQAVRDGLAFFSTSHEEDDMRAHHLLCKSFRDLLSLVLPSLGPPNTEDFGYASLYQFVSLTLPQGFAQPLVDSPMVTRRMSQTQRADNKKAPKLTASPPRTRHRSSSKGEGAPSPHLADPSAALAPSATESKHRRAESSAAAFAVAPEPEQRRSSITTASPATRPPPNTPTALRASASGSPATVRAQNPSRVSATMSPPPATAKHRSINVDALFTPPGKEKKSTPQPTAILSPRAMDSAAISDLPSSPFYGKEK